MNAPHNTRTFKSGNSVAVRLPKGFGIAAGAEVALERRGREVVIRRIADPVEAKVRMGQLADLLDALGPIGEVEVRDPDIFPDRPGLY
ncbi:MAG: AbrB/MazE/SpoVT family DNA-binding domain-containing protein [Novosphingobium sp.]|jgi:antitoxin VapB